MYALKNRKKDNTNGNPSDKADDKLYAHVWSREGRIYCRTAQEVLTRIKHPVTGNSVMPKPHIVNKPQDLENLGWSPEEIQKIINNVRQ